MAFKIPNLSLVVLVGASGAGKSTFARQHFLPTEILSSDACRGLVSDDANNQAATDDAFDVLFYIARKRLTAGRLTVIDATNVSLESRKALLSLAREFHVIPVAIVLNLPEKVCVARNRQRTDRNFGAHVIFQQRARLRRSLRRLKKEGFRHVLMLNSEEDVADAQVQRVPLWNDRTDDRGPFDFIGDVHSCCDELELLLDRLGYVARFSEKQPGWSNLCYAHPAGRKAVFVGDLIDRGPRAVDTLSLVRNMVANGSALCVPGNHDIKLLRKLRGKDVNLKHGLAETLADIEKIPAEEQAAFKSQLIEFIDGLVSHYVLDRGKVVVAHAGLPESMHGRGSGKVRSFALYGETTGETDEFGLPVRHNWAADYRGDAQVVYGHTPVPRAQWLNNTIDIDTGCVFGGKLTALRYPEQELVSVDAAAVYCQPTKPLALSSLDPLSDQQIQDDLLDADDVLGKRVVSTRLRSNITIREENSAAALEIISRFAVDPKWLIYLPPTMSPAESSNQTGYLEHPLEALDYFRQKNVRHVICQQKHMGSRAIVVVCKDEKAAQDRFGVRDGQIGTVYTRTGRPFFANPTLHQEFLDRVTRLLSEADFWQRLNTDWACLDCELMPWSAKAQDLLKNQYAAVGAAARQALPPVVEQLSRAAKRFQDLNSVTEADAAARATRAHELMQRFQQTQTNVGKFTTAYREYCWPVTSIDDFKLAPFHVLATENAVHIDKDHRWHMQQIDRLSASSHRVDNDTAPWLMATRSIELDLDSPDSVNQGVDWWLQLTADGGEGMVIKPIDFVARETGPKKGLLQPAIKCRGREYLRIIYGPDYDTDENLKRLRRRNVGHKRSLALREFALGIEALERFVDCQPLRKTHQCVFSVLALESEPVDPRL